jgi:hypothetical protein
VEGGRGAPPFTPAGDDSMSEQKPQQLEVRISGRDRPERIAATAGVSIQEELARFLNRQGPYAQMWIRLVSGEYVRYDLIASVCVPTESSGPGEPASD